MGPDIPPDESFMGQGDVSGGMFIYIRRDDPDGAERLAAFEAAIRDQIGDEAFRRMKRSQDLHGNPRALSEAETAVLRETLAPVLRDLAATGQTLPDVREEAHEDRGEDAVCAWISGPGGTGEGISIWLPSTWPDRLSELAGQLQSWKNDDLIDGGHHPWPQCRDHPDYAPLSPNTRDGVAVWVCYPADHVIAEIGKLGQT